MERVAKKAAPPFLTEQLLPVMDTIRRPQKGATRASHPKYTTITPDCQERFTISGLSTTPKTAHRGPDPGPRGARERGARSAPQSGGEAAHTGLAHPAAPQRGAQGRGGGRGRTPPTTAAAATQGQRPGGAGQERGQPGRQPPQPPPGRSGAAPRRRGEDPPGPEATEARPQPGDTARTTARGPPQGGTPPDRAGAKGKQRGGPAGGAARAGGPQPARRRRNAPGRGRAGGRVWNKRRPTAAGGGRPEQGRTPTRVWARWAGIPPGGPGAAGTGGPRSGAEGPRGGPPGTRRPPSAAAPFMARVIGRSPVCRRI